VASSIDGAGQVGGGNTWLMLLPTRHLALILPAEATSNLGREL
jgi:hypothetical protein